MNRLHDAMLKFNRRVYVGPFARDDEGTARTEALRQFGVPAHLSSSSITRVDDDVIQGLVIAAHRAKGAEARS